MLKKKIWANFQRIIELFTKIIVKALKNMVLGSGIRKKPIPDPGSRGQKAPDPGSATLRRIRMFLGHPDPLVRGMNPAPAPSIIKQKR